MDLLFFHVYFHMLIFLYDILILHLYMLLYIYLFHILHIKLYLLLFLLYIDYADIYRIFVYCRIRVRVLQEAALIVGGIPLSLRQLRTKDRDERRLSALRGNQRVGIPFLPKGFVPLSAKTCNAVRCLPGWDVLSA